MKKHILILSLIIFGYHTQASAKVNYIHLYPYADTTNIIQDNIISHKEKFKHRELNAILIELHLMIKSYTYLLPSKPGGPIKGIILSFENPATVSHKISNRIFVPSLHIYFESQISLLKALQLDRKSNGNWGQAEIDFYGKQLVKDVEVSKRQ